MEDQRAVALLALTVAMPFIAGFHVSMGAPWMLTGVLVDAMCLGVFYYSNRQIIETLPDSPTAEKASEQKSSQPQSPV